MTVKQLIELLSQQPEDNRISIGDERGLQLGDDCFYYQLAEVRSSGENTTLVIGQED